jgi:hypothetical protein
VPAAGRGIDSEFARLGLGEDARWWVVSGAAAVGEPLDGTAGEVGGRSKQVRWREEEDEQCMI